MPKPGGHVNAVGARFRPLRKQAYAGSNPALSTISKSTKPSGVVLECRDRCHAFVDGPIAGPTGLAGKQTQSNDTRSSNAARHERSRAQ